MKHLHDGPRPFAIAILLLFIMTVLSSSMVSGLTLTIDKPEYNPTDLVVVVANDTDYPVTFQVIWNGTTMVLYNASSESGASTLNFRVDDHILGRVTVYAATPQDTASIGFDVVTKSIIPDPTDNGNGVDGDDDSTVAPPLPMVMGVILIGSVAALGGAWSVEASRWFLAAIPAAVVGKRLAEKENTPSIRMMILKLIRALPGVSLNRIMELQNLATGQAYHHLNHLERDGLIVSQREGRNRCFYPRGLKIKQQRSTVTPSGTQYDILLLLDERKRPMDKDELATEMMLEVSTVSYNVNILEENGFVDAVRMGRRKLFMLPGTQDEILEMLEERPMTLAELSSRMDRHPPTVQLHLAMMMEKGYVVSVKHKQEFFVLASEPNTYTCPMCTVSFKMDIEPTFCPNCQTMLKET